MADASNQDSSPDPQPSALPAKIPALNPETQQVVMIDSGDASTAQQAGWSLLSKHDALDQSFKAYLNTPAAQVATAAGGYLRGLSGGLSDLMLDKTGAVPGKALAQMSEENPIASGVGHGLGIAAGLLAGGEGEAAGEGASALGSLAGGIPGLASHLGGEAVERLGLEGAEGLGATLARGAVRGAVETPFYGVGDKITEDVFENKPLTAESLLAEAGKDAVLGGLTGGALEGALGLAADKLPAGFQKASKWLDRLAEKSKEGATNTPNEIRSVASNLSRTDEHLSSAVDDLENKDSGEAAKEILGNSDQTGAAVNDAIDTIQSKYTRPAYDASPDLKTFADHVQGNQDALRAFERKLYGEYKPAEVERLIGGEQAEGEVGSVTERAISKIEAGDHQTAASRKISEVMGKAGVDQAQTKADEFSVLDNAKRELDAIKPPPGAQGMMTATERLYYDSIAKARDVVADSLKNREYFGEAAKLQSELNPLDAARRASLKGYKKALLRAPENSDEMGLQAATDKIQSFAERREGGKFSFGDKAKSVEAYSRDTADFLKRAAEIAPDPQAKAEALALAKRFVQTPDVAESAAAAVRKQKTLAKSPLEFGGAESRDAGRELVKLREQIDGAKNDAERFGAIKSAWRDLANAKKLRPGMAELRDKLNGVLSDQSVFGAAAKHHVETSEAISGWRQASAELKQVLFSKREGIADEGKVTKLVTQLGRGDARADPLVRAIEAHDSAARNLMDVAERGTYNRIGSVTPSARMALRDLEESNQSISRAAGSMAKDLDVTNGGQLHGNPLAGWTHIAHIPGVAHVADMIPGGRLASRFLEKGMNSEVIGKIARHASKVSEQIRLGAKSALESPVAQAATTTAASLGAISAHGRAVRGESLIDAVARRRDEIDSLQRNDEKRTDALSGAVTTIQRHAPGIAGQMQMAMQNRDAYLSSQAPRSPIPDGSSATPPKTYKPSPTEAAKFARQHRAAFDPVSSLEDLKHGTLTPEVVATVRATSPQLYSQMSEALVSELAKRDDPPPYPQRAQIALFLGKPVDYSQKMLPRTQADYQAGGMTSPKESATNATPRARESGLAKLNLAERAETKFDSTGRES